MNCLIPDWPAPANIKALTTTRHSWGQGAYINKIAYEDFLAKDSKALETLFHLPETPIWLNQTHTNIVLQASPENRAQEGDASFTSKANRVCVVITADCLPILLCNQAGTKVAAIHAGWRGLGHHIIENTLDALDEAPAQLLAWLGPAIGPQKFEVGRDVYDLFTTNDVRAKSAFKATSSEKWLANLYELAALRLQLRGVTQIFGGDYCTYTQTDLFFSYRRNKNEPGRMASMIWLT